jgi:hypothetical protein
LEVVVRELETAQRLLQRVLDAVGDEQAGE